MKMQKRLFMFLMAGLLSIGCTLPVMATEMDEDSAGNVFISGDSVSVPNLSAFCTIAAGQNLEISDLEAEGGLMAAGQMLSVSGANIGESVFVAGNIITLNNLEAHGNIFAAGNSIKIIGNCEAKGIYAAGSDFEFDGTAQCINVAAKNVTIKGEIDGDVNISAENVEIAEGAVITGKLDIESVNEPDIADSAQIGDVEFEQTEAEDDGTSIGSRIVKKITSGLYWIVAMAAFGMLLCWLFAHHIEEAAVMIREKTGAMIVSGIIAWICIPIACILLCVSMILAPTGGMLGIAYVLFLCAGLAFTGCSVSRIVFPKMNIFLSSLIGIAVLEAFRVVPVIGTLLGIAADIYLLGYVVVHVWSQRLQKKAS